MNKKDRRVGLNGTSIFVLLLLRIVVFLFSILITLKSNVMYEQCRDVILLGSGTYHILVVCMYWPAIKTPVTRLLLCVSDLLIALAVVVLTGGIASPFLLSIFIPVFTLHIVYGWRGLAGGLFCMLLGTLAYLSASDGFLQTGIDERNKSIIVLGISLALFYLVPYLALAQYSRIHNQLKNLKIKYNEQDGMNSKLLMLYEMTGRFNYQNGIAQVMDRLLALCEELFPAQCVCIFLIRSGEVEIYGKPTAQEKEDIYRLILEQNKTAAQGKEESEYILQEDALVIPLIRGARTDGVLSFNGWKQNEITGREVVLFSMIANMVCTYLENLEYVESLKSKLQPSTSVMLNQLDSGKAVKGVLDKRIVNSSLE